MTVSTHRKVHDFISAVSAVRLSQVFNPYSDTCTLHDRSDAPAIRRRNLARALTAAMEHGVDSVWIARDLGYRGGRRTGLPLTDEAHLAAYAGLLRSEALARATVGPTVAERTASVIWGALSWSAAPVFLWNVFPFHPHHPGAPESNRPHTAAERKIGATFLSGLLEMLPVERIFAIGADASGCLTRLGRASIRLRHPSYGGAREFAAGLKRYRSP